MVESRGRPLVDKLVEKRRALLFGFSMLDLECGFFQRVIFIKNALVLRPS